VPPHRVEGRGSVESVEEKHRMDVSGREYGALILKEGLPAYRGHTRGARISTTIHRST
jgi:hypothetical protein